MNSTISGNAKLRKHSTKRYKKLREQYIGSGNNNKTPYYQHPLSPEEIKAGRERAIAYYTKRNKRIYSQIIVISLITLIIICWGVLRFL